MIVTCPDCGKTYDDVDHWTFCPHKWFPMNTMAMRGDGTTKVCTSVKELEDFMAGKA